MSEPLPTFSRWPFDFAWARCRLDVRFAVWCDSMLEDILKGTGYFSLKL